MNIIFVANNYTEHGGFHHYLYRVTKALHEMGHKVTIVKCGEKNLHRFSDGIEIWEVSVSNSKIKNSLIREVCDEFRASKCVNKKIKEILRTNKVDIIQFTSLKGVALLYCEKVPAVLRLSSYAKYNFSPCETLSKNAVKVLSFLEIMAGRRCNAVFAPSNVTAKAYEKDFHKKVYMIETPYVDDVKQLDYSIAERRLKSKKYVLFFGHLYYEKGILTIAEMIKEFLENNQEYCWVFAGKISNIQGVNAAKILSKAAGNCRERVIFLGELSLEQLYPVIQGSEFVVLPSITENFANACIEAMHFSKLVIGTNGTSFEQLIQDNVSGLLCKINDSHDLLDKMQKAVNMSVMEKRQIEQRAHERIEKLKPEYVVRRLIKFYECIMEMDCR